MGAIRDNGCFGTAGISEPVVPKGGDSGVEETNGSFWCRKWCGADCIECAARRANAGAVCVSAIALAILGSGIVGGAAVRAVSSSTVYGAVVEEGDLEQLNSALEHHILAAANAWAVLEVLGVS